MPRIDTRTGTLLRRSECRFRRMKTSLFFDIDAFSSTVGLKGHFYSYFREAMRMLREEDRDPPGHRTAALPGPAQAVAHGSVFPLAGSYAEGTDSYGSSGIGGKIPNST